MISWLEQETYTNISENTVSSMKHLLKNICRINLDFLKFHILAQ